MPDLKTFALAAGLSEDADEATILAAVTEHSQRPTEAKTLDDLAKEEGKIVLSAEDVTKLRADAQKGADAAETLRVTRFETAYTTCLSAGQMPTDDETKGEWRELFDAAPDLTLKRMGALPKVVNLDAPKGSGHTPSGGSSFEGFDADPDRADLHTRTLAYAGEHNVDYAIALAAVAGE